MRNPRLEQIIQSLMRNPKLEEPLEGVEQEETSTLSSQNMMGGGFTDFHPSKGGQYEQIQFPSKSVTCNFLCPHMAFPL